MVPEMPYLKAGNGMRDTILNSWNMVLQIPYQKAGNGMGGTMCFKQNGIQSTILYM